MRKTNTQKIDEVINEYLDSINLKSKMKEARIAGYWEEIMGKTIANKTTNIYLKQKNLYVYVNSSVLRNELMMMREKIINLLNEKMEDNMIDKIVLN